MEVVVALEEESVASEGLASVEQEVGWFRRPSSKPWV